MKEIWKQIKGYEELYSMSNHGKIRRDRQSSGTQKGLILKSIENTYGYLSVSLYKNKIQKVHRIHILVANNFIGKRPKNLQINHKDCNKENNYFLNLEYITQTDNIIHAYKNGLIKGSKLTEKDVRKIRELYAKKKYNVMKLAKAFNTSETSIYNIIRKRTWKHI